VQRGGEEVRHRPVVSAGAVVGRLRNDRRGGTGESLCRVEADRGARSVQDDNVVNVATAQFVDQEWKGSAPESAGDADHRALVDQRESVAEWPEAVDWIAGLQLGEQARPRTHCLEHEAAGVILGPGDAERTAQQWRRSGAASQLRKRSRRRGCGKVRQARDQFQQTAAEALHHEYLALLERGPAQIRRHVTAWTSPSRYACTVATRTLCPEVCRPMASTSAAAVSSDVQHGMRRCSAASLMR